MQEKPLSFVIPTYRLREVGETVASYDEHFWRNGHSVSTVVFDDSSAANHEKYSHRVFMPTADFIPAPPATPDNPKPRRSTTPGSFRILVLEP